MCFFSLFFNNTATTAIYTLSLHDALPIFDRGRPRRLRGRTSRRRTVAGRPLRRRRDRKSTRLNSSHVAISYAVFCLKKKKITSMGDIPEIMTIPDIGSTMDLQTQSKADKS